MNIVFNLFSVVFHLASLLLFIPFLSILFNTKDTSEMITQNPGLQFTKQGFEDYFNYQVYNYLGDGDKISALAFICVLITALFFFKNLFRYLAMHQIAVVRMGVLKGYTQQIV